MISRPRWIQPLVLACFFLSGMAGLAYQTAWARYLGLFLGHTSYAVVAVLVAFMGGLAIGNAWLGARADRTSRPLALYAWLEIGIGVYALAFPIYYEFCHDAYVACVRSVGVGTALSLALKFGFSFLTILLPTLLMGATFPALTRFVTQSLGELREKVASLYFINSAGAVAGCVAADFWWIPGLGLEATVFIAAALNLGVGLATLVTSLRLLEGQGEPPEPEPEAVGTAASAERFAPAELRLALVAIGVSGFVAMLYEVVWTRLLCLALGSSTHAFSLMLITFISGITAGAWVVSRWRRVGRTFDAFGWAELALAGTLLASMFFYEYLPLWFAKLANLLQRRESAYPLYALLQALLCFGVMFIPTLCLGTTLPLASRIATESLAGSGRSVGATFAVNTLGTVLGAAATGLWLLPALGLARTFALGIGLNAVLAVAILTRERWLGQPRLLVATPLVVAVWTWLAGALFDADWRRVFTAGLWRSTDPPASLEAMKKDFVGSRLAYYRDGAGSTVSVLEYPRPAETNYALKVNGKTDASTGADMTTQVLLGHIPLLLKPDSTKALVIGLGSGVTAAAVTLHPPLQRVDVVEISREVVEGARVFRGVNRDVHQHPKVRIIVDDAKSHLLSTTDTYDVIVSEPSNPWMAGVAGVFTQEFYRNCQERLATNGLMIQWVQAYETSDATFDMVLATYASVFPHVAVWSAALDDLLLVGSMQPIQPDLARLVERARHPAVRADLERIHITNLPLLLSLELVPAQNAAFIPALEARIHSDLHPGLEYVAQRAFFVRGRAEGWRVHDDTLWPRPTTLLAQHLARNPLTPAECREFVGFHIGGVMFPAQLVKSVLLEWQRLEPDADEPLRQLLRVGEAPSSAENRLLRLEPLYDRLVAEAGSDAALLRQYAMTAITVYREHRSAFHRPDTHRLVRALERLLETDAANARVYRLHLAELAWDEGNDAACMGLAAAALDPDTVRHGPVDFSLDRYAPAAVICRITLIHIAAGRLREAWRFCDDLEKKAYLGPRAAFKYQRLELLYRKLYAVIGAQEGAAGAAPQTAATR